MSNLLYQVVITTPKGLIIATEPTTNRDKAWAEYQERCTENALNHGERRIELIRHHGLIINNNYEEFKI